MNKHSIGCEQLYSYFLDELTGAEKLSYIAHLSACSSCQHELRQLQQTWDTLPHSMDVQEPPEEWKTELLGAIIQGPVAESKQVATFTRRKWSWTHYAAAAAVLLVLIGGGAAGMFTNQSGQEAKMDQTPVPTPSRTIDLVALKSFDAALPSASGQVSVMEKDGSLVIALQTKGLPALQGEEAYQMWMVKDGVRFNCGTFHVDAQGNGLLTYRVDGYGAEFDTIGITREPDGNGSQPRGKKVLGT